MRTLMQNLFEKKKKMRINKMNKKKKKKNVTFERHSEERIKEERGVQDPASEVGSSLEKKRLKRNKKFKK